MLFGHSAIVTKPLLLACMMLALFSQLDAQSARQQDNRYEYVSMIDGGIHFAFGQKVRLWSSLLPAGDEAIVSSPLLSFFNSPLSVSEKQPYAYDAQHLAFFCRLEVRLEKATKIPVRFRIGDVQQVDYLEGKFTGWRYGY